MSRPIQILYIEDDSNLAKLIKIKLENSGYCVNIATSGEEGLKMLASNDYDLLALDETLPGQKGRDVVVSLVNKKSLLPTIMITGTGNEHLAKEMIKIGVSDYLIKGDEVLSSLPKLVEKVLEDHKIQREKQKSLQKIKDTAARYRSTFKYVPAGLFRIDLQGVISKANPSLIQMLKCADYKKNALRLFDRFADPKDGKRWRKVLKKRGSVHDFEVRMQWQDNAPLWVEISVQEVRGEDGKILYYEGCIKDITEHWKEKQQLKEMLVDIKKRQQNIVQQERLLALGQIASGMAHDINNALSPILGYSELLLCQGGWESGTERKLKSIAACASDIAATVSRLHKFYRKKMDQDKLEPLKISTLIEEAVSCTKPRWRDIQQQRGVNVRVHVDLSHNIPWILGLETELRQMMTNLIFNAVEAMPTGGDIHISASAQDGWVIIKVIDTGIGMSDEVHQRCLEPFFTTKIERGAGMGLSVVYGIINRHQGKIDIETTLGQGTSITLKLPISNGKANSNRGKSVVTNSAKILCVDDEALVRDFLKDMLSFLGYSYEIKNGGQEGIDAFAKGKFNAVITDLGMPGVDGAAVANAIKQKSPDTPVILLTGWGTSIRVNDNIPPGVDYLLDKPVKPHELQEALIHVLKKN